MVVAVVVVEVAEWIVRKRIYDPNNDWISRILKAIKCSLSLKMSQRVGVKEQAATAVHKQSNQINYYCPVETAQA